MKYSEIVKLLHNKYNYLSYNELKNITDQVFEFIKLSVKEGKKVEIRGFGMFEAKLYKAKNSFNPKSLEYAVLPDRRVPFYKASTVLKRNINKEMQ